MRIVKHPTGFTKVILGSLFGRQVRIHIWPRGHQDVRPDVHGHRWRFLSLPLWGRFIDQRWHARPGNDHDVILCADNGEILEPAGKGSIEMVRAYLRRACVPYFCGLDELHSFHPLGTGLHLTLVFLGRHHKPRAVVYLPGSD